MKFPRLYPILDTATLHRRGIEDWTVVAGAWLAAGAEIIQIRHKIAQNQTWTRTDLTQAAAIKQHCDRNHAQLIINDRADVAALLEAGLHVGQEDLTPQDCRRVVGHQTTIGYSTHNAAQLHEAGKEPVDYLAFGPIFATQSKERPDPLVGLKSLANARTKTTKPLIAIGGITQQNVQEVFEAGADSVAVIAGLLPDPLTPFSLQDKLKERMEQWQRLTRQ